MHILGGRGHCQPQRWSHRKGRARGGSVQTRQRFAPAGLRWERPQTSSALGAARSVSALPPQDKQVLLAELPFTGVPHGWALSQSPERAPRVPSCLSASRILLSAKQRLALCPCVRQGSANPKLQVTMTGIRKDGNGAETRHLISVSEDPIGPSAPHPGYAERGIRTSGASWAPRARSETPASHVLETLTWGSAHNRVTLSLRIQSPLT